MQKDQGINFLSSLSLVDTVGLDVNLKRKEVVNGKNTRRNEKMG